MTREEALNILHNASVYHPDYLDAFNMAIKALEQEPKTGHWIDHTYTNSMRITFIDYECSACHEHTDTWQSNYCPNCGARMESEG